MSDRPLHEVVEGLRGVIVAHPSDWMGPAGPEFQPELAAVLKAADALAAAVVRKNMALRAMVEEARMFSEWSKFGPLEREMESALAECAEMQARANYDAAVADLRRALEGK